MGGGIYLEKNTNLFIVNNGQNVDSSRSTSITFTSNRAMTKGGAMYVLDRPHTCKGLNTFPYTTRQCFLQIIDQHEVQPSYLATRQYFNEASIDTVKIHFY